MEDLRKELLDNFKGLEFQEKEHKYFFEGNPIKTSVSGVIKKYVLPFDEYTISLRVAKRRNVSQDEVLKEWNNEKVRACNKGNDAHLFGELYPFDKQMQPKNKMQEAIVKFWNDLPEHVVPVIMELKMFHKQYMFAGTADIILYNTETKMFIIGDYKTNKDLFKNFKNKKMLGVFSDLLDCPFNKYQLQLSFYQILFEQTGFKVSSRKIVWLLPDGTYKIYNTVNYTDILKEELKTLRI